MTDDDQAARLAAIRAKRAQTASPSAAARHIAAGARIVVTGLTASGIFGLTTVIAAANRPADDAATADGTDPAAIPTTPTTLYADPTGSTLPVVGTTALPSQPGATVVLTIPPAAAPAPTAAASGQPAPATTKATTAPVTAAPAPGVTQAPVVTPAPTPPPTTAAPATTTPPPATTTCTSANHKKGLC